MTTDYNQLRRWADNTDEDLRGAAQALALVDIAESLSKIGELLELATRPVSIVLKEEK